MRGSRPRRGIARPAAWVMRRGLVLPFLALTLLLSGCSVSVGTTGARVAHVTGPFQPVTIPATGMYTVRYSVHGDCVRAFELKSQSGAMVTVADLHTTISVGGVVSGSASTSLQQGTYTFDDTSTGICSYTVDFYGPA